MHDLGQLISEEEDDEYVRSIRSLSLKLISELVDKLGDPSIQALILVSEKFLKNFDEKHTVNMMSDLFSSIQDNDMKGTYMHDINKEKLMNYIKTSNFDCDMQDFQWKKREVGQLLLGNFANDLIYFSEKN